MKLLKKASLKQKNRKHVYQFTSIVFLVLNLIIYTGVYAATHYGFPGIFGLGLAKPTSPKLPSDLGLAYSTQKIPVNSTEYLETWLIPARNGASKGTIILFPGIGDSKGKHLLPLAQKFNSLNYDTLLVDFLGVGGSTGDSISIGLREAKDVALVFNYAQKSQLKHPLILDGISMGSAAILRAVAKENINPDGIILELPFAYLTNAIGSRIRGAGIPSFPLAEMVVFWGGIQHGFNAFAHNPVDYASQVKCPTLLMYGRLDPWTTKTDIDSIFQNLHGTKKLVEFPKAGHDLLLVTVDPSYWQQNVEDFLAKVQP
jgi:uncharacterized protein